MDPHLPPDVVDAMSIRPEPEERLEHTRAMIRARLAPGPHNNKSTSSEGMSPKVVMQEVVEPMARQLMQDHPYRMLGGAAAAGALLVWWKPWRMTGPLIAGLLAKNVGAASVAWAVSSLSRFLDQTQQPSPPPG